MMMCAGCAEGSGSNDDLIAWLCVATGIDNAARQNHFEIANKKFHVYASEMTERNDEFCPALWVHRALVLAMLCTMYGVSMMNIRWLLPAQNTHKSE